MARTVVEKDARCRTASSCCGINFYVKGVEGSVPSSK
jgi:hypothetical protein